MANGAGVVWLAIAGIGGYVLYTLYQSGALDDLSQVANDPADAATDAVDDAESAVSGSQIDPGAYTGNPNYQQWQPTIASAAAQYGLPSGLLDNLLYEESHYRTDIITGATTSSTGAQGIAQFEPSTAAQFGIDPLDPSQAIPAAAQYLSQLASQFSANWTAAVAAYNWGPGNVSKFLAGTKTSVPAETTNYVAAILGATLTA